MSKVTLNTIRSNYASTSVLNDNFSRIAEALDKTLSRTGDLPNQMEADLDLNGYSIINCPLVQNLLDRIEALETKVNG